MSVKRCSLCGFTCESSLAHEFFHVDRRLIGGLRSNCTMCSNEQRRQYSMTDAGRRSQNRCREIAAGKESTKNRMKRFKQTDKWRDIIRRVKVKRRTGIAVTSDLTSEQWSHILERYGWCCAYCQVFLGDEATRDHVVPLSRGGGHTASNVVPCCRMCNSIKGTNVWKPITPKVRL